MTGISDLLDLRLLDEMIADGFVRRQEHPELPLAILNYAEKATYDNVWNPVTLQCRGLIYRRDTGKVVARPFPKFFNYGQPGAPEIDLNEPAVVTDKLDGSLGILYPTPEGHAVATRGSFLSDQALHATELWRQRYAAFAPMPGYTYLFEIVYPQNRVVVDYGALDDLILLEVIHVQTGLPLPLDAAGHDRWPGPAASRFEYHTTLAEALAAPERPGQEGFVLYFPGRDTRLKIKHEDYVRLHRIVTGLNARSVWEHLSAGMPLGELIAPLPDEFHPWVRDVAAQLRATVEGQLAEIRAAYDSILAELDGEGVDSTDFTRKDFALKATQTPWPWALFNLLDGVDPMPLLWRNARPSHFWNPAGHVFSEDTA